MKKEQTINHMRKKKMFLKHCYSHPLDTLQLGKSIVLHGFTGAKACASEFAQKEWNDRNYENMKKQKKRGDIKFSIIMPVYNVKIKWLKKAIQSVIDQSYENWELCIVDDGSTEFVIREYLRTITDKRIKTKYLEKNKGISEASNEAASMATGDYLLLMDNDDELSVDALNAFYKNLLKTHADIIYSDMDMVDEKGCHSAPLFKPDWSPELMHSQMYLGHLIGFKKELFNEVCGFQREYDGAQDYDLLLRMSEITGNISHVSRILYSWRMLPTSTAANATSKPYAQQAGRKAIQAHLDRTMGQGNATVEETENLFVYDVRYNIKKLPFVTIIIPTKDHADDLKVLLDSIFEETSYDKYEIIVLNNNSKQRETYVYFEKLKDIHKNIRILDAKYEFNWSKLNNQAICEAKGDVFVFLNNDVKILEPTWLQRLVEYAIQPDIGVVGGLLLYEDGSIQHAGVVAGMGGWADHVYKGARPIHQGTPFISPMVTRNVTACTGACMAISRDAIDRVGGFDERFRICGSDVEICIRMLNEGYRNVYIPQVKLFHYESKTRDSNIPQVDFELSDIMYSGYRKGGDPYYNKNLDINSCIPTVKIEEKKNNKKIETIKIGIEAIRELHFRKIERKQYRLNLVLPSLNAEHMYGGISTALKCFEILGNELGCDMRIILTDIDLNSEAIVKYSNKYEIISSQDKSDVSHQIVSMVDRSRKTLAVSENDQFMFTSWWSAYIIQNEYERWEGGNSLLPKPFLYLIQDYEPGFYPWSSEYILAESTYRCRYPQIAIFNSFELKEFILNKGYNFVETYCFEPVLNSVLKEKIHLLDDTVYKRKQILVYGRPSVSRNAFEIIISSLKKWVAMQPDVESWTVLSAGEKHASVYLGEGVYLESVGKLTIEEYAKVLQESYAGISLMISPHPSYPPLEMAIFDVRTITNTYENKDLSKFSDNIISIERLNPVSIAKQLKKICDGYRVAVPHKAMNNEYTNTEGSFGFIKELKEKLMCEIG